MQTQQPQKVEPPPANSRRGWLVAAAAFAVVLIVGAVALFSLTSTDSPTATTPTEPATETAAPAAVAIRAMVDLGEAPVLGTFEVTAGADALGCSSGTLESMSISETSSKHVMTCESGSAGTFTIRYSRDLFTWSVVESSGDFSGLEGEGGFDFAMTSSSTVVETFTGDIQYAP